MASPTLSRPTATGDLRRSGALWLQYLGPLRWRVALLALLVLGSVALQLTGPQLLRLFIDAATNGASVQRLLVVAFVFVGVAMAGQVSTLLTSYLSEDVGWRATNRLRSDLTRHCLQLDLEFHKARTPGEMIERVDGDVTAMSNFFARFVVMVLVNLLFLVGILVMLVRVDWRVGAALALFVACSFWVQMRLRGRSTASFAATRQADAELFGYVGERLAGTEDIRSSGAVSYVMRGLFRHLTARLRTQVDVSRFVSRIIAGSFLLFGLGSVLAISLGGYLVSAQAITLGEAYMIFFYTEQFRLPVDQILQQLQDLQRAGASVQRVLALLATPRQAPHQAPHQAPPETGTPLPSGPLAVELQAVSFGYAAGQTVLHDLSLALRPGETVGLLGRTGSGKTTIARLVARLYDPGEGVVRLGGVDLRAADHADLRRRVGVVTQDVQLFAATLRQNLALFDPAVPDERMLAALQEVGLWEWYCSLPAGLETELAAGGGLSAGEAQLLAFARVLLRDPGLVILDEASSRLDPATEARVERAVQRLLTGRTGIIVAHRLATVQQVDTILILDDGRVQEYGPRAALAAQVDSRFAHLLRTGLEEVLS